MSNLAIPYWEERFSVGSEHHSNQNSQISKDFIINMSMQVDQLFHSSFSILEVGCGTGELSKFLKEKYNKKTLGTDFSEFAIKFANEHYADDVLKFKQLDLLNDNFEENYDIAICSNTLEHFTNPYILLDKILQHSPICVVLVPYNQPCTDGREFEGGAGHVFQFNEKSFERYNILNSFMFKTDGWQHSSCGEEPLQYVITIKNK